MMSDNIVTPDGANCGEGYDLSVGGGGSVVLEVFFGKQQLAREEASYSHSHRTDVVLEATTGVHSGTLPSAPHRSAQAKAATKTQCTITPSDTPVQPRCNYLIIKKKPKKVPPKCPKLLF